MIFFRTVQTKLATTATVSESPQVTFPGDVLRATAALRGFSTSMAGTSGATEFNTLEVQILPLEIDGKTVTVPIEAGWLQGSTTQDMDYDIDVLVIADVEISTVDPTRVASITVSWPTGATSPTVSPDNATIADPSAIKWTATGCAIVGIYGLADTQFSKAFVVDESGILSWYVYDLDTEEGEYPYSLLLVRNNTEIYYLDPKITNQPPPA